MTIAQIQAALGPVDPLALGVSATAVKLTRNALMLLRISLIRLSMARSLAGRRHKNKMRT